MKRITKTIGSFALAVAVAITLKAFEGNTEGPRYTTDGQLVRPTDYREWVYLSSGLGMSYTQSTPRTDPVFDNVFVNRSAYRAFLDTGRWPDKTVMILELRQSRSKESINTGGHFQAGFVAM